MHWFAIFFNTPSKQTEKYYFLQIQPIWRPDLFSMVEPWRRRHSPLHPLSVNKILEQKRSMTSEFLYTVIDSLLISKTKFSYSVQSNWLSTALISALIGRCNRKVCVMRKYNWTEKCSIRHCTHTLECVESKARESVIKFLVQWIICNYTCQGIKQFGFSLNLIAILFYRS